MTFFIVFLGIFFLVCLITLGKFNPFIAFLIVSIFIGLCLGIPLNSITQSIYKGIGDTLGSLVVIIVLGAMLGKLVAESGAAQKITTVMMGLFGEKYIRWALMVTGFIIGIPLFYNVGFVLMIPLIFSVVYKYKLPAVYIGIPMLASLSVTHGFLPPHPAPAALVQQFHANMGLTLMYGIVIAIPAIIIAGPLFSRRLKHIVSAPLQGFYTQTLPEDQLPDAANSFISSLFPVILLMATTILLFFVPEKSIAGIVLKFLGDPAITLLLSVCLATYTLGIYYGKSIQSIMTIYAESVKDVGLILLIVGGAGALKQIFIDGGVSKEIGLALADLQIHPLILAWLIAAIIRVCLGSATIAGLTTAGIMAPTIAQSHIHPSLMVLSIGAGSLFFSHVNDAGFWLFKEYFNLSVKDTMRSWSTMETIVSVVGLIGVMLLNVFVH
jgi:Gnt-I system high-affinity gluconate transporter